MKVPDKHFILEKAKKYLNEDINSSRYIEEVDISGWRYMEFDADDAPHGLADFEDLPQSDFVPISISDRWGGYDRTAWFTTNLEIPHGFIKPGMKYGLRLELGEGRGWGQNVEGLLYINGTAVQGIDSCHLEVFINGDITKWRQLKLAIKAWAGLPDKPKFRVFGETKLFMVHPAADEFYFVAKALTDSIPLLPKNDLKRFKLAKLLQETFKHINFLNPKSEEYYASIEDALHFLKTGLAELRKPEVKPTIHAVGHSHIDMAWLWRLSATREKASRTFATVLNLMRQYPEYYFMHSSPQLYKFLEEDYPEIFTRVRAKIVSGEWEATGGMWVESDTNVPSGESLVRQFLFGLRYFKKTFGVEQKVLWLPDVFGYSAALPQIAKKSGIDYFMTTKISWNQYNHFPHDTFKWRGIDGTEMLTHFITTSSDAWFYTYNGQMVAEEIPGIWANYKQKEINSDLLLAYGFGDGGGGPTREMLESRRAMEDIPGIPYVKTAKVEPYFALLDKNVRDGEMETWDGELYFEFHRGTYTSQGYNKKANRKMENLLHDAEFLSILSNMRGGGAYPQNELSDIWETVLLLQFHDIIPGSSIRQVYEDSRKDYKMLLEKTETIVNNAAVSIVKSNALNKDSIVVFNTLSFNRDAEVLVPYSDVVKKTSTFVDSQGTAMFAQPAADGIFVVFQGVPAYGYRSYTIEEGLASDSYEIEAINFDKERIIRTEFFEIVFNEKGEIVRLFDISANREVGKGPLNELQAFEDKPLSFDAWDIDVFYKEKPYYSFECTCLKLMEKGPCYVVVRRELKFNESEIVQDIIINSFTARIDFKTRVDWKERQVLLKAAFPLDIRATSASYEIQFGFVERPNHSNDERAFAQFEVCGHKWADVSEGNYGAALINDCKYGYDCKDSVLRLTLIKSPINPDETADRCVHEFNYALYPHEFDLSISNVQAVAADFNNPAYAYEVKASPEGSDYADFSLVRVNTAYPHVVVDTIKKAEDSDDIILRVFEAENKTRTTLSISVDESVKIASVQETNLIEEALDEQDVEFTKTSNTFGFGIKPFEVKTFLLCLDEN